MWWEGVQYFCASFGLIPLECTTAYKNLSLWQSLVQSLVVSFQCICIWLLNLLLQTWCPRNFLFRFLTIRWEFSHFHIQSHVPVSPPCSSTQQNRDTSPDSPHPFQRPLTLWRQWVAFTPWMAGRAWMTWLDSYLSNDMKWICFCLPDETIQ